MKVAEIIIILDFHIVNLRWMPPDLSTISFSSHLSDEVFLNENPALEIVKMIYHL